MNQIKIKVFIVIPLLIILFTSSLSSQKFTLSGYVKDVSNGETLIGAAVFNKEKTNDGTVSNTYGFYSLSLDKGTYTIVYSYLGFQNQEFEIVLDKDIELDVEMDNGVFIDEIVVSAEKDEAKKNVESTKMGTVELPVEQIKKLPALMGEVDILKSIQLLPGVSSGGEGNSGFYVRGGGPDQNLVLLDEALVYNSGHLLGFFSVFNADAIKNTTLIKGGMPANYGGRLSSVVDVQIKEGNNKFYEAEGGIGLISSRLTFQGPIVKDKASFIISGRRTYILDLLQPFLKGGNFEGTNYFFYDLNTKLNWKLSKKDKIFISGYFGRDVLTLNQPNRDFEFNLPYGNSTITARWNHLFNNKLFMNVTGVYNDYQFEFLGGQDEFKFQLFSGVKDYNLKVDFDFFANNKHSIKFGLNSTHHELTPSTVSASAGDVNFKSTIDPKYALENAIYVKDEWKINSRISLDYGLRYSIFTQIGPYTRDESTSFEPWEAVKTYQGFEPRISGKNSFSENQSIKAGITRTNQYIHLVSNSSSTLPTDVWSPSTERVKPQLGIQYAIGYFQNFLDNMVETSIEIYYKDLQNQLDYSETSVTELGVDEELKFISGKGRAYGAELFVKKSKGKLNGWVGYTLSRSERSFDDINNGEWFAAVYDRTHDISIVANYSISPKWDASAVFVYGTGQAYTPLAGLYSIENTLNFFYGPRNSARLPDYHRADISVNYNPKPNLNKKFSGSWSFGIYNIYNRKNPFFTYFEESPDSLPTAPALDSYKVTIFPIIPSITYNYKWRQKVKK